ncbi:MAG: hypothetical protein K6T54_05925 [Ignavibacterium sp.]|nr:hypothetical protein [Ignavibacterium sp.]
MKKLLLILTTTLIITTTIHSQNQVIARLKQPSPNKLTVADLWQLKLNNTTRNEIKGYVLGTLSEANDGLIAEAKSKILIIKPGNNSYSYNDFSDADINISNNKYKEIFLRSGNAPEGDYTICVTVYNEEDEVIGTESCIEHIVRMAGNISLLTPNDGEEMDTEQPLLFSWTPVPGVNNYTLKIVEVFEGQTPEVAIEQNRPLLTETITNGNNYQLSSSKLKTMLRGIEKKDIWRGMAWRVSSDDISSDVFTFKPKPETKPSEPSKNNFRFTIVFAEGNEVQSDKLERALLGQLDSDFLEFLKTSDYDNKNFLPLIAGFSEKCPPDGCGACAGEPGESCDCAIFNGGCICKMCPDFRPSINLPEPADSSIIDVLVILKDSLSSESLLQAFEKGVEKISRLRNNPDSERVNKIKFTPYPKQADLLIFEDRVHFYLSIPENVLAAEQIDNLMADLELIGSSLVVEGNRHTIKHKSSGGNFKTSSTNNLTPELLELSENFINIANSEDWINYDPVIIVAKQVPCPPTNCGCPKGREDCNCVYLKSVDFCACPPCIKNKGGGSGGHPHTINSQSDLRNFLIIFSEKDELSDATFNRIKKTLGQISVDISAKEKPKDKDKPKPKDDKPRRGHVTLIKG